MRYRTSIKIDGEGISSSPHIISFPYKVVETDKQAYYPYLRYVPDPSRPTFSSSRNSNETILYLYRGYVEDLIDDLRKCYADSIVGEYIDKNGWYDESDESEEAQDTVNRHNCVFDCIDRYKLARRIRDAHVQSVIEDVADEFLKNDVDYSATDIYRFAVETEMNAGVPFNTFCRVLCDYAKTNDSKIVKNANKAYSLW